MYLLLLVSKSPTWHLAKRWARLLKTRASSSKSCRSALTRCCYHTSWHILSCLACCSRVYLAHSTLHTGQQCLIVLIGSSGLSLLESDFLYVYLKIPHHVDQLRLSCSNANFTRQRHITHLTPGSAYSRGMRYPMLKPISHDLLPARRQLLYMLLVHHLLTDMKHSQPKHSSLGLVLGMHHPQQC